MRTWTTTQSGFRAASPTFSPDADPGTWHFIYRGVLAGNGDGDPISPEKAARISEAFTLPYSYSRIRLADLYDDAAFCSSCNEAYCYRHWNVSDTGGGKCPQGHRKLLDPHWSPDD